MQEKLDAGEAMDVSEFPIVDGDFVITHNYVDGLDYCVASTEEWIWSIGRRPDGVILASRSNKYYDNPDFECLWLR
jgi:hypothetical protein